MIQKPNNQFITFSIFEKFPELVCVMSNRQLGNLNVGKLPIENASPLLKLLNIPLTQFVSMRQRHTNIVASVGQKQGGTLIQDTDGLIAEGKNLFLGVKAADCVPLFFYDPVEKIVATAHAGWKGTLGEIAVKIVQKLQKLGTVPKNLFVAIGPHIGGCCYKVQHERAQLFLDKFNDSRVAFQIKDEWFVDLGFANKQQLLVAGIEPVHIDASITCTSCQNDLYFSFRKDSKETFGEMLGIIGMKN